ncbi:MAG: hypothetical protein R3A52_32610 [Polyangiales bacterium]
MTRTPLLAITLLTVLGWSCGRAHAVDAGVAPRRRVDVPPPPRGGPPTPPPARPTVRIPDGTDEHCTTDAECRGGYCFTPELEAQYSRVFRDCPDGQAWRARHQLNTCIRAACQSDAACPEGERCADIQMLPFPQRACIPAGCRQWSDCRRRGGAMGTCVSYVAGLFCQTGGWACSFPGDECAPNNLQRRCVAPEGETAVCVPQNGRFRCVNQSPPTP